MGPCFATEDKPEIFFGGSLHRLQIPEVKF
jgi:hypothetical protein